MPLFGNVMYLIKLFFFVHLEVSKLLHEFTHLLLDTCLLEWKACLVKSKMYFIFYDMQNGGIAIFEYYNHFII